jgi:hypothetical protein
MLWLVLRDNHVSFVTLHWTYQYRSRYALWSWMNLRTFLHGTTDHVGPGPSHYRGFAITLRHTTLSRTSLDDWSVRRRELMTPKQSQEAIFHATAGIWTRSPSKGAPQTHVLDRAATGIFKGNMHFKFIFLDSNLNLNSCVIDWLSERATVCRTFWLH